MIGEIGGEGDGCLGGGLGGIGEGSHGGSGEGVLTGHGGGVGDLGVSGGSSFGTRLGGFNGWLEEVDAFFCSGVIGRF